MIFILNKRGNQDKKKCAAHRGSAFEAGGQGFEPRLMVPETTVLPIKLSPNVRVFYRKFSKKATTDRRLPLISQVSLVGFGCLKLGGL
jgi:hypothetical protein